MRHELYDVRTWRRHHKLLSSALIVLIAGLLALRFFLPEIVRDQINARLDRMGDYHGHVDDVDIHLWRGGYTLNGLVIEKTTGKVPVPLLNAPLLDLSISWKEIFHGGLVGKAEFDRPEVNFVDGGPRGNGQSGRGVDWREQLEALVPMKLNELRIVDGTLFFHNFVSDPEVDLRATGVDAVIENLTNVRDKAGKRVADLDAQAKVLGDAPLELKASFDPFEQFQDFTFDLKVTDIELVRLNKLLQAYAKLDAASGHGDIVVQLQAQDGALSGYAKPIMKDVKIASWQQDVEQQHDNPLRVAWEATAGFMKNLLKNHSEDQFATKVEFRGSIKNPKPSTLDALINILHNAFVEAYKPQFEEAREKKPD